MAGVLHDSDADVPYDEEAAADRLARARARLGHRQGHHRERHHRVREDLHQGREMECCNRRRQQGHGSELHQRRGLPFEGLLRLEAAHLGDLPVLPCVRPCRVAEESAYQCETTEGREEVGLAYLRAIPAER